MEGCRIKFIKTLMFAFNLLFWLSGLALIAVGAYIYANYNDYFSYADNKFARAEYFIIAVGVIVFVIGFLGCCGVARENYCMITTFAVLLSIILVLEVAAAIVGYTFKKEVKDIASSAMERAIKNYDNEIGAKKLLDWSQATFSCCGNNGANDYRKAACGKYRGVPSCHAGKKCSGKLFKVGCREKFIDFIKDNMSIIGAVAIAITFVEIVGIVFSCLLMRAIKHEYEVV